MQRDCWEQPLPCTSEQSLPCGRAAVGEAEGAAGPVDTLPAERVRHGGRTLDLRAEQRREASTRVYRVALEK